MWESPPTVQRRYDPHRDGRSYGADHSERSAEYCTQCFASPNIGNFSEIYSHNREIGRFSDVVYYDLIITFRKALYHAMAETYRYSAQFRGCVTPVSCCFRILEPDIIRSGRFLDVVRGVISVSHYVKLPEYPGTYQANGVARSISQSRFVGMVNNYTWYYRCCSV